MPTNVIAFPGSKVRLGKITQDELTILTTRVLNEVFAGNWRSMFDDYTNYCQERDLRLKRTIHYDWACERLDIATTRINTHA